MTSVVAQPIRTRADQWTSPMRVQIVRAAPIGTGSTAVPVRSGDDPPVLAPLSPVRPLRLVPPFGPQQFDGHAGHRGNDEWPACPGYSPLGANTSTARIFLGMRRESAVHTAASTSCRNSRRRVPAGGSVG